MGQQLSVEQDDGTPRKPFREQKERLIQQLQAKYKRIYEAVQPIPYVRDRLFSVDKVFIQAGIEEQGDNGLVNFISHHDVFRDLHMIPGHRIVIGEPGYGKSTLSLQYAYDWCNAVQHSYLKNVDILILLRVRQLGGVSSIYEAIRLFLLHKNFEITVDEIESVLRNVSSVVVILDGYDEYPDSKSDQGNVFRLILNIMNSKFKVLLTSRYVPVQLKGKLKELRLVGFNEKARDEYIQRVVAIDMDMTAIHKLKVALQANPILADLCQVPLFFVMSAHMSHDNQADFQKIKSVTTFFKYMIECFYSHMRNKMENANVKQHYLHEENHDQLDKVAFTSLGKLKSKASWKQGELITLIGQSIYNEYVKIGILVEEVEDGAICSDVFTDRSQTLVRFYHKLFCEWYAAKHFAMILPKLSKDDLAFHFEDKDIYDNQFLYRFACGLNGDATKTIVEWVKKANGPDEFVKLCILERNGDVESVMGNVKELCSKDVSITQSQSRLLRRSTVELLRIASMNDLSIFRLNLRNEIQAVESSGKNIHLNSKISIPVLHTLRELDIVEIGRKMTSEEFHNILHYSHACTDLKKLWLRFCLLPRSLSPECLKLVSTRKFEVLWFAGGRTSYQLNFETGSWEFRPGWSKEKMTDKTYEEVVKMVDKHRVKDLLFDLTLPRETTM